MALTLSSQPQVTVDGETSRWLAAHNPLLFVVAASPINTGHYVELEIEDLSGSRIALVKIYPDTNGFVSLNLSQFVKTQLSKSNTNTYTQGRVLDYLKGFVLKGQEFWDGGSNSQVTLTASSYSIVNAAMQFTDTYGENMIEYVMGDPISASLLTNDDFDSALSVGWTSTTFNVFNPNPYTAGGRYYAEGQTFTGEGGYFQIEQSMTIPALSGGHYAACEIHVNPGYTCTLYAEDSGNYTQLDTTNGTGILFGQVFSYNGAIRLRVSGGPGTITSPVQVNYLRIVTAQGAKKFLTEFKKLRIWRGYPFSLSVISEAMNVSLQDSDSIATINMIMTKGVNHINPDLDSDVALGSGDVDSSYGIYFNSARISELKEFYYHNQGCFKNPLYVRWLNTLGGWDYWLFEFDQSHGVKTKTETQVQNYVDDIGLVNSDIEVIEKSALPTIRVGAEGLTRDEAQGLEVLGYSVQVEMYLSTGSWQAVRIADGTFRVYRTLIHTSTIEFEIVKPNIQIQNG